MSARRKKHEEHEEHENHERWLVTYADMVTLLMVLFIVMFAMSAVDKEKYNALKSGLAVGFGQDSILQGNQSILADDDSPITTINPQLSNASLSQKEKTAVDAAVQEQNRLAEERAMGEAEQEVERLDEVYDRLQSALRKHGLAKDVQASYDERGLVLSLVSKHVVFDANMATLSARGREVVDTLAPVLRDLPDKLQVDGHTNQAAGNPKFFATDWDLSAARAITVLRRLNETHWIPAQRLSLSAFGRERPLVDPGKSGSQQVNKRVDIVIVSDAPASTRAKFDEAAATPGTGSHGTAPGTAEHASDTSGSDASADSHDEPTDPGEPETTDDHDTTEGAH